MDKGNQPIIYQAAKHNSQIPLYSSSTYPTRLFTCIFQRHARGLVSVTARVARLNVGQDIGEGLNPITNGYTITNVMLHWPTVDYFTFHYLGLKPLAVLLLYSETTREDLDQS